MAAQKWKDFLKSVKRAEGYGEAVHLMHTSPKEKKSKGLYNFADLIFWNC